MDLAATGRTAIRIFRRARITLHQEQVAAMLFAIGDPVIRRAALRASAHHIIRDPFCQPTIEDEILAFVLAGQPFRLYLPRVVDYAAIHLAHFRISVVPEVCTRLLTTDTARAVE